MFKITIFKGVKDVTELMLDFNFPTEESLIVFMEHNFANGYNIFHSSNLIFFERVNTAEFSLSTIDSPDSVLSMNTIFSTFKTKNFDECFIEDFEYSDQLKNALEKIYYVVKDYDTK